MPLTGGDNLADWADPHEPDDHVVGHFRGDLESLNIANAQPGFHYYYARNNPNDIVRFLNQGWTPVGPDDAESYGAKRIKSWNIQHSLGTERAFQDVILMKIPLEKYRAMQKENESYKKTLLDGVVHNFRERGDSRSRELHRPPQGRSLYYASPEHGQTTEER